MEALMSFLDAQHSEVLLLQEKLRKAIRDCKKRKAAQRRREADRRKRGLPWFGVDTSILFGGEFPIRRDDGGRARDNIKRFMDEAVRGGAGAQEAADEASRLRGIYGGG